VAKKARHKELFSSLYQWSSTNKGEVSPLLWVFFYKEIES